MGFAFYGSGPGRPSSPPRFSSLPARHGPALRAVFGTDAKLAAECPAGLALEALSIAHEVTVLADVGHNAVGAYERPGDRTAAFYRSVFGE